jgi:hypothetical protein
MLGMPKVQAQMYATYQREYENFTHLLSESIDALFQRFTVVVNNMRANVDVLPYNDHDRAVKLLHLLDCTVWGGKFEAIVESEKYDSLTVNELFSKLKSAEVDRGMTTKIEGPTDSHSLALIDGSKGKANANPSTRMFSLSSLMSMPDEEFDVLREDELALLMRRFERLHENRVNMRRNTRTCFQCSKPGHFVTDCPEKVENKDSYKNKSRTDGKYRSRRDHKSKHKDERRSRKKESRGKARAMVGASDVDSSSACSTSSSSSSEDEGDSRKGRKSSKNLSGLSCFARYGFYTMTLSSGSKKSTQSDSDSDSDDEVRDELPFLHLENERLSLLLDNRDDMLREAKKMRKKLRASLEDGRTRVANKNKYYRSNGVLEPRLQMPRAKASVRTVPAWGERKAAGGAAGWATPVRSVRGTGQTGEGLDRQQFEFRAHTDARFGSGGRGSGGWAGEFAGGQFARRSPPRAQYWNGMSCSFELERRDDPRLSFRGFGSLPVREGWFPHSGYRGGFRGGSFGRKDGLDCANPTFEQMARRWFYSFGTNPSAESFVRSRAYF